MGKFITVILCLAAAAVIAIGSFALMAVGTYNGLQTSLQGVNSAWSKVESQYQRRFDLIPNLVETTKAAANFEKSTLTAVTEARASVGRAQIDISKVTQEQLNQFQAANSGLTAALSRLMVVTENYPTLKANENFMSLTTELAGTENRVTVARNDFNNAVQKYNNAIKVFPGVLLANFFGFEEKPYFKATENANTAPTVKF